MRTITNLILTFLFFIPFTASGVNEGFPSCDPDSLIYIEISGSVILSRNGSADFFFLDVDDDGDPEYRLNFGPYWYSPEGGDVSRPAQGDFISITGGMNEDHWNIMSVIIVYSIDDHFWRNPYAGYWNHFSSNYRPNGMGHGYGHAPGWLEDTITTKHFTGRIMVDSTFIFCEYFLDTDSDGYPDIILNFGPPWYQPPGNLEYPASGDPVSVYGRLIEMPLHKVLIVLAVNGETWQDESHMGAGSFGRWMIRNQYNEFHDPFDPFTMVRLDRDWAQAQFPESIFCQLIQTHYQVLPDMRESRAFAAFELGIFFKEPGMGGMGHGGGMNNNTMSSLMEINNYQIDLRSVAHLQFHYSNRQLQRQGVTGQENVSLYGWDYPSRSWIRLRLADRDPVSNTVSLSSSRLYAFYMLAWDQKTTSTYENQSLPEIVKFQIQGNPASDYLKVNLDLSSDLPVQLDLFNALGIRVFDLLNTTLPRGKIFLEFACDHLSPGMYYLQLRSSGRMVSRPVLIQH